MSIITKTPLSYFIGLLSIIFLTIFHEIGHFFLIKRFNLTTLSITILPILGYCEYYESQYEYENFTIAWGGVIAQIILLIPAFILLKIFPTISNQYLKNLLLVFGPYNLIIMILNLLPIAILDGSRCWKSIPLFLKYGFIKFPKKTKSKKSHKTQYKNFKVVK